MNIFYMDSSAIVKRYVMEAGSEWILRLCEGRNSESLEQSNLVMVAEITLVEVAAAIARRTIKTKELGVSEGSNIYKLFVEHFEGEYRVIALTPALVRAAADMAQKHALRAYDAVQLACAVHADSHLRAITLRSFSFLPMLIYSKPRALKAWRPKIRLTTNDFSQGA